MASQPNTKQVAQASKALKVPQAKAQTILKAALAHGAKRKRK